MKNAKVCCGNKFPQGEQDMDFPSRCGILPRCNISTRRDFGFTCMRNVIVYTGM